TGSRLSHFQNQGRLLNIKGLPADARASVTIYAAAFSPDGTLVAVATGNDVTLWDVAGRRKLPHHATHHAPVTSVVCSPDGQLVAAASLMEDYRLRVWDVAAIYKVRDFGPHSHQLTHLAFAPSGRLIGSASGDHTALIWDLTGLAPNGTMHKPKVSAE